MAQRRRKRRTAAKIATKREQQSLEQKAARFAEDPSPLVPALHGKVKDGPVKRLEKRLRSISKKRGKAGWLGWYKGRGPMIARAYATLLLIDAKGSSSRMASMPTPAGELKYAYRGGNVSRRALVGVQHHDQPLARIMAYRELANECDAIAWLVGDGVTFGAKNAAPPEAWIDEALGDIDIELDIVEGDDGVRLETAAFEGIVTADLHGTGAAARNVPYGIEIKLPAGPLRVLLDKPTLESAKGEKVLHTLGMRFIGLEVHKDVSITPVGLPWTASDDAAADALARHTPTLTQKRREAFLTGVIPENAILLDFESRWRDNVEGSDEEVLIAGDTCYGADRKAFLAAIPGSDAQRDALTIFLDVHAGPIVLAEPTMGKLLERVWTHAGKALPRILDDGKALDRILAQHAQSPPAVILDEVLTAVVARERLGGYPVWDDLPSTVVDVDRVFRVHRALGREAALETADRILKGRTHKGALHAVLGHLEALQGREWRFNRNDQDASEFLHDAVVAVFEADEAGYAAKLAEVHTLAGGAGSLPAPSGTV